MTSTAATTRELFARAVAVAVQGVMNSRPQRLPDQKTLHHHIAMFAVTTDRLGQAGVLVGAMKPGAKGSPTISEAFEFVPDPATPTTFRWQTRPYDEYFRSRGRATLRSQGEVEKALALAFTKPYPVTRVSTAAVQLAHDLIADNIDVSLTLAHFG